MTEVAYLVHRIRFSSTIQAKNQVDVSITMEHPQAQLGSIVSSWVSVAFCGVGAMVIVTKCIMDYTHLRLACMIIGIFTLLTAVLNAIRTLNLIGELEFYDFFVAALLLYVNLSIAISFNLGAKFYSAKDYRNFFYWLTVLLLAAFNVLGIGSRLAIDVFLQFKLSENMVLSSEAICLVGMFFALMYAFMPLIKPIHGRVRPSGGVDIVEVGVWYLGGLTVNLLLNLIILVLSIVYPTEIYWELDVEIIAYSFILRMIFLVWYSLPPPKSTIKAIRRTIFPRSQNGTTSTMGPASLSQFNSASDRFEMHLSNGKKLEDDANSKLTV